MAPLPPGRDRPARCSSLAAAGCGRLTRSGRCAARPGRAACGAQAAAVPRDRAGTRRPRDAGGVAMTAIAQAPPAPASAPRTYTIGHGALLHALERTTVRVVVPAVGTVHLPPVEDLAWFGGIAVLVAGGGLGGAGAGGPGPGRPPG